MELGPL